MIRLLLPSLLALFTLQLYAAELHSQEQPERNVKTQAELVEFVRQAVPFLNSGQLQQRQQAELALIAEGPRVLVRTWSGASDRENMHSCALASSIFKCLETSQRKLWW